MNTSTIEIKSISQITGKFFIPDYQRGYRWEETEVSDLMKDLLAFYVACKENKEKSYSLQPLVVKKRDNQDLLKKIRNSNSVDEVKQLLSSEEHWEVVDGQQRLTSILILLQALNADIKYSIEYDVVEKSRDFIKNISTISETEANKDINLSHIYDAYQTIEKFLKDNISEKYNDFREVISENVKFVWYEAEEENSLEIFKRLNVGKIALTESELIKALFLNRSNFKGQEHRQAEIAREWDSIETLLQDDEFWLFIQSASNYQKPTRIDFLLGFYVGFDKNLEPEKGKEATFRSFYKYYNNPDKNILDLWQGIKQIISVWKTWYDDIETYHLIGFIINFKIKELFVLTNDWQGSLKDKFKESLYESIKEKYFKEFDPERIYVDEKGDKKGETRPYLLLMNILTVIDQNAVMEKNEQYKQGVFYKFPFHLFKKEKWDIEHIDSATQNELENRKAQEEWIRSVFFMLNDDQKEEMRKKDDFKNFLNNLNNENDVFERLYKDLCEKSNVEVVKKEQTQSEWKNKIYNYALLDAHTNRSYKNAIFSFKRAQIIDKEKGISNTYYWDKEKEDYKQSPLPIISAFVPPCTQNVFKLAYSTNPESFSEWKENDAKMYRNEMVRLFNKYITKKEK